MLPLDSPNHQPEVDMKSRLVYWLLMQGLGVVVLVAWAYVQWHDIKQYREENKACNAEMIRIYQQQNEQMLVLMRDIRDYMYRNAPPPSTTVSR